MVENPSRDQAAFVAAHRIYAGVNNRPPATLPPNIFHNVDPGLHSINSDGECLIEGAERRGQMSPVRRFFSLFVTFDFLFTGFLWIICLVISNYDIKQALVLQVVKFSVSTSLFDVVLTSLCRVTFLLLAYALFRISHWWTVALTTSGSSAFLIAKVVLYKWNNDVHYNNNYQVFSVILILCSFVICWGEAWFLDFRVIPQETRARDIIRNCNERDPLLPEIPATKYESVSGAETLTFYSPVQSREESEDEFDERVTNEAIASQVRSGSIHASQRFQGNVYKEKGKNALEVALKFIASDNWKLEKSSANDTVHSQLLENSKAGKIFKLTSIVPVKPKNLFNEIYTNVENVSEWNPNVKESKILEIIDENTDVTYQISSEAGNGAVTVRDFVNLRYWEFRSGCYMIGTVSVEHPSMPPKKEFIRGESGPGGCFLRPSSYSRNECLFEWLLSIDLKGWLPQYLVDQTLASIMLEYVHHLRKHLDKTPIANSV